MDYNNIDLDRFYDEYGDFHFQKYFSFTFKDFPSTIEVRLSVKSIKNNFDFVHEVLSHSFGNLELIYRELRIGKTITDSEKKDFPYKQILIDTQLNLGIYMLMENNEMIIQFYFHHSNHSVEEKIKLTANNLKSRFGKKDTPVFHVLTRGHGDFYTEELNIDHPNLDILANYNDDFAEIDAIITQSIQTDTSGLILLHGIPGTGKTTYIKHLVSKYKDINFIFIPNDFVVELLKPNFITFLIRNKNSVLVIEDAEKVIVSRENDDHHSVVSTILQLTDGLFSSYLNIKIICTFNTSLDKIDSALLRKGRLIAYYEFKPLSVEKSNKLLGDKLNSNQEELTLADIYNRDKMNFNEVLQRKNIGFGS